MNVQVEKTDSTYFILQ